jgi:hypothetical protein
MNVRQFEDGQFARPIRLMNPLLGLLTLPRHLLLRRTALLTINSFNYQPMFEDRYTGGRCQGGRQGRCRSAVAAGSPVTSRFCGSQDSGRPSCIATLARMQLAAEMWLCSTSVMGRFAGWDSCFEGLVHFVSGWSPLDWCRYVADSARKWICLNSQTARGAYDRGGRNRSPCARRSRDHC